MYCVKCGVKLQDSVEKCPLCGTPVWNPDTGEDRKPVLNNYPINMPEHFREKSLGILYLLTAFCVLVIATTAAICLKLYGNLAWSGYVTGGILTFYVMAILPAWFRHPRPEIFIPVNHVAIALLTLFINEKTGGHWFLSFALPVTAAACVISTAIFCLFKYVQGGRLFILAGFLVSLGLYSMLIEFLIHVTFGVPMFWWSVIVLTVLALAGGLLILAGVVKPLRSSLERRFFF